MKYNIENIFDHMQEIREEEERRKQNSATDKNNTVAADKPSVPELGSQEYIDNLDTPGAMDDGVALLLYIVAMVISAIFKARLLLWVGATIVYLSHVFRRQIYKANWERNHKNK